MKQTFIAGPCVIESAELLDTVASKLVEINKKLGTNIIFKASFDKANRTSVHSFRGPGIDHGLLMLSDVKSKYGLRVLTDIHESWQAEPAGQVCDVLQIPAFLQDGEHQEGTVSQWTRHEVPRRESPRRRCQGGLADGAWQYDGLQQSGGRLP